MIVVSVFLFRVWYSVVGNMVCCGRNGCVVVCWVERYVSYTLQIVTLVKVYRCITVAEFAFVVRQMLS